jgi:protein involved in polysaccharide export with SLBB domain
MRVSELIPDKESLVTRNYWWKRAQLGLPAPEFEPAPNFATMRQPMDNHSITLKSSTNELQQNQSGLQPNQSEAQQGQFETLQDRNQNLTAQQRAGSSSLGAEQSDFLTRKFPTVQRTEVRLLAPEIDWNYAVIERLDSENLRTTLVSFDLGKLVLQHDAAQDIQLQPGDVVSIFSEADVRLPIAQQTKLVKLEGEFVHAGTYSVQPGETLRQLVERAGGLTPNAYLYGSEFTRESTRILQQARIDEYVQTLGMRIQRSNLAIAGSSLSASQASGAMAQTNEHELLTNLRQIRATGRVVLRLQPATSGISNLPDITMEDGDRFVIPSVPATVNVIGAVYDQNSFLFANGLRAGAYLQQAGGLNRDANRKSEFIIRADGEVVSYETTKGFWGSEFVNQRIYPGDTIVIPEKTFKPGALSNLMGVTQMISQLGLGAASLNAVF